MKFGNYNQAIQFAAKAIRLNKYQLVSYDVISKAYKDLGNEPGSCKVSKTL